jgi:hypothetical protein
MNQGGLEVIEQDNEEDEAPEKSELEVLKRDTNSSANSNITADFVNGEPSTIKSNGEIVSASIRNAEENKAEEDQSDMLYPAIIPNSETQNGSTIELVGTTKPHSQ